MIASILIPPTKNRSSSGLSIYLKISLSICLSLCPYIVSLASMHIYICIYVYSHPGVNRIPGFFSKIETPFKNHILSTPGWLYLYVCTCNMTGPACGALYTQAGLQGQLQRTAVTGSIPQQNAMGQQRGLLQSHALGICNLRRTIGAVGRLSLRSLSPSDLSPRHFNSTPARQVDDSTQMQFRPGTLSTQMNLNTSEKKTTQSAARLLNAAASCRSHIPTCEQESQASSPCSICI